MVTDSEESLSGAETARINLQEEDLILTAEEHVVAIRSCLLRLEEAGVQLRRKQLEERLKIGEHVEELHKLKAHPCTGDFVANLKRCGLTVSSAYRYRSLFLESTGKSANESFPIGKDSLGDCVFTPQGEVSPESLLVAQKIAPSPPEPAHGNPVLRYNDAERLEYEFYVRQLRQQFQKEIPSGDEAHIVLQALRGVANDCGYFYVSPTSIVAA